MRNTAHFILLAGLSLPLFLTGFSSAQQTPGKEASSAPSQTAKETEEFIRLLTGKIADPDYRLYDRDLSSWTEQELKAAMVEGFQDSTSGRSHHPYYPAMDLIMRELMKRDRDAVLAWADQFQPSEARLRIRYFISFWWPQEDAIRGLSLTLDPSSPHWNTPLIIKGLNQAARQGPAMVEEMLRQARRKTGSRTYYRGWQLDFPKDFDFNTLAKGKELRLLLDAGEPSARPIFTMWIKRDPAAVETYLATWKAGKLPPGEEWPSPTDLMRKKEPDTGTQQSAPKATSPIAHTLAALVQDLRRTPGDPALFHAMEHTPTPHLHALFDYCNQWLSQPGMPEYNQSAESMLLMQESIATVIYRREGEKALPAAQRIEDESLRRSLMESLTSIAVKEDPLHAKPWVDQMCKAFGENQRARFTEKMFETNTDLTAEEILKRKDLYGENLNDVNLTHSPFPPGFDFATMLRRSKPEDQNIKAMVGCWSARDPKAALQGALEFARAHPDDFTGYIPDVFQGIREVKGGAAAAQFFLAEKDQLSRIQQMFAIESLQQEEDPYSLKNKGSYHSTEVIGVLLPSAGKSANAMILSALAPRNDPAQSANLLNKIDSRPQRIELLRKAAQRHAQAGMFSEQRDLRRDYFRKTAEAAGFTPEETTQVIAVFDDR